MMDDRTRNDLLAKLVEARERAAMALQRLRLHDANIKEVRKALGNPYFYGGRPDDDPESEAHFTGSKSHEPALQLILDWNDASRQVAAIRNQLRDVGIETD
jgi:hypothetical protein